MQGAVHGYRLGQGACHATFKNFLGTFPGKRCAPVSGPVCPAVYHPSLPALPRLQEGSEGPAGDTTHIGQGPRDTTPIGRGVMRYAWANALKKGPFSHALVSLAL